MGREAVGEQQSHQRGVVVHRAVNEQLHFICVRSGAQSRRKLGRLARRGGVASVEGGELGILSSQGSLGHPC